jgi:hypothetical protein
LIAVLIGYAPPPHDNEGTVSAYPSIVDGGRATSCHPLCGYGGLEAALTTNSPTDISSRRLGVCIRRALFPRALPVNCNNTAGAPPSPGEPCFWDYQCLASVDIRAHSGFTVSFRQFRSARQICSDVVDCRKLPLVAFGLVAQEGARPQPSFRVQVVSSHRHFENTRYATVLPRAEREECAIGS